tara:strand:+ start:156 stop:518 length:363 start_codon:yes stop_codon:yes gene_type:complete
MSQSSQSFKFITHNFAFLNRSLNGPGLKVHAAEDNEFVTLTMSKCISNDTDYVLAENPQNVIFRIYIGDSNICLIREVIFGTILSIPNIPVSNGKEIWIACNVPNQYCVYGFASQFPVCS